MDLQEKTRHLGVKPPRYKARLVAKRFTKIEGVDYTKIFSLVVKLTTIRVLSALIIQLDIETKFLYRDLKRIS